jgi:hypothetical protein
MKGFSKLARLLIVFGLSATVTTGLATTPAAAAVRLCVLCSKTTNSSGGSVFVVKSWTCSGGSTGSSSTGCAGGETRWISNGDSTPAFEDWDVFRVDAGWCYRVRFMIPYKDWEVTYDRRGQGAHLYVKVEDHATAIIKSQSTSFCL